MSEMISVASGFQYSVNIGYDINHDDKLQNFIPTKSSLELLRDILLSVEDASTERARVLVGAYGKGKSHIVLTILSILMRKDWNTFTKLQEKVKEDAELTRCVKNFYDSKKRLLPVIISGSSSSMPQSFLLALQKALSENNLMDVMPETNYQAAINAIQKWKDDFPDTYKKLKKEIGRPVDKLVKEIEEYNVEAYEEFVKLYPMLTSGSIFNPFVGFDVIELYESVVKHIRSRGYTGIYVVYDEFSKFLEANIKEASVSDTKMLQDFAEKCNRSGKNQLHLLLISHKEIANYIDTLPKQKVDGWRGVSDRFKHIHLNNNFTQTYEIISSVILKDNRRGWKDFKREHADAFEELIKRYSAHAIFADSTKEIVSNTVYGCYPLHPVTTFILPRLSERVAQNERTLFTFLSAKGMATLPTYLDSCHDDAFSVLTPDVIFDYFEPLFRKESYTSEIHDNYILTKNILEKLDNASLEAKIIKTISLIYILEQFDKIRPTYSELVEIYSLDYDVSVIREAIDHLIYKEYVVYLKLSNDFLRLKQSSGVDIKQEISDMIERNRSKFSVKDSLNTASIDNYMYPARYNDDREMTRYFTFVFIDGAEVEDDTDWDIKSESIGGDGVIYGIIPESGDAIKKLRKKVTATSKGKERCIFVIPNKYTEIADVVLKFNAVTALKNAAEGNELLFDEYEVIYEDLRDVIAGFIAQYTHPESFQAVYIYDGNEKSITRKAGLTGLMSDICERVYARTPVINNEAVNKTELTGVAINSRSKIITGLLRNHLEPGLGLTGTGQEVSILRSTLLRKRVIIEDNGITEVNLKTGDENMDYMLGEIVSFIHAAKKRGECSFDDLYCTLTSPKKGIGLRKALIPLYLAAVLHEYRQEAVIVCDMGELPINADTLMQIEADPARYGIKYLDWDPEKEKYINQLEELFADYVNETEKAANSYDYIASAMRRWYMALPKYSKERNPQSDDRRYRALTKLLKQNIGGHELLFMRLPKELGAEDNYELLAVEIGKAKAFYDEVIHLLVRSLAEYIRGLFAKNGGADLPGRSSMISVIRDWEESLDSSVYEQLFDNGADKLLGLIKDISNDGDEFVNRLGRLITGLRLEDWDDKTVVQFEDKLKEYKETIEEFSGENNKEICGETSKYSLTFIDEEGKTVTKRFDRVEQSRRGKLLMNSIVSEIDSMGHSISEQEKRQILMEILKTMC